MEEQQCVDIWLNKIDDKVNEEKERKRGKEKENRRSKHREKRRAEKGESREEEENIQKRETGEEVRIDKNEEESINNDYEGQIMDYGNSENLAQTLLDCQEDYLIVKEEKPVKYIKSTHNRGETGDCGSKGKWRDDKYGSRHRRSRGERDSKGGGERILGLPEQVPFPGVHSDRRKGSSETLRAASEKLEKWMDPCVCSLSDCPKYTYWDNVEKDENFKHHERQYCPSPETARDPDYPVAHIIHTNLSGPEPKVKQTRHRSPDKAARLEGKASHRRHAKSRQCSNVQLYMSELAHHSQTKSSDPTPQAGTPASSERSRRRSRRSSKQDIGSGNCTHTVRADEEVPNARDDDKQIISETPRETPTEAGSKEKSREDRYYRGDEGERDSKAGGETAAQPRAYPDDSQGGSDRFRIVSGTRDSCEDPFSKPSYRPEHSSQASKIEGDPEKYSGPCCMPAEPNLRTSQIIDYPALADIVSPEVGRKDVKHKSLSKGQLKVEAAAKEQSNIQPEQRVAAELTTAGAKLKSAADVEKLPSGLGDVSLSPKKTRKSSRGKNTVSVNTPESWSGQESARALVNKGDGYGEGGMVKPGGPMSLNNWGDGVFAPESHTVEKHRFPEAEKKEKNQGSRPHHSRRPRYRYATNTEMEDENFYPLYKSISSCSQRPTDSVCRITKSEYMVSSSSICPEVNRKLVKISNSLGKQPSALSNFTKKQFEIATSMHSTGAHGSPNMSCPLCSASPTKDKPNLSEGLHFGDSALTPKSPNPGAHVELNAANVLGRLDGEKQGGSYCKPFPHDLPDGDTDREREKPASTHSNTSLRHRAKPSPRLSLAESTVRVDIPRPIASESKNDLTETSAYGAEVSSDKIPLQTGHFKEQSQKPEKRVLQTRKRYQEEMNAAITIQAAWRGHLIRAHIRKLAQAATRIQAAYRGYQIRKIISGAIGQNEVDEVIDIQEEEWPRAEDPEAFYDELSRSDYSGSDVYSGEDWLESPVGIMVDNPGSSKGETLKREVSTGDARSPNPFLQNESGYPSQNCTWGGI